MPPFRTTTDQRARTHIAALITELKHQITTPAAAPAQIFISGMLTGLASSVDVLNGGTAEAAIEHVGERLAAAVGRAYLDGKLPARSDEEQGAPVDWQANARDLENKLKAESERRYNTEQERDSAYRERAHLVALLAAMTDGAVITYATDVDEPGWQIVYLNLDGCQASWHISPRDADLFEHVQRVEHDDPRAQWDGHTTEEKYAGIAAWTAELAQRCGPACAEQHTHLKSWAEAGEEAGRRISQGFAGGITGPSA